MEHYYNSKNINFFKRQIYEEKLKTKTPCLENVECTSNNVELKYLLSQGKSP